MYLLLTFLILLMSIPDFLKQGGDEFGGGTSSDDTDIDAVITEYRKSVPVSVATVSGTREGQPGRAQQVQKYFYTPSP